MSRPKNTICNKFNWRAVHPFDYMGQRKYRAIHSREYLASLREFMQEMQKNRCFYCTIEMTPAGKGRRACSAEHLTPRSKGGKTNIHNIVAACVGCNSTRGTSDWLSFLKTKHPMYKVA